MKKFIAAFAVMFFATTAYAKEQTDFKEITFFKVMLLNKNFLMRTNNRAPITKSCFLYSCTYGRINMILLNQRNKSL